MARRRHTPVIIRKLAGLTCCSKHMARHLEVSEQTYHRWRNQFGGMKATTPSGSRTSTRTPA